MKKFTSILLSVFSVLTMQAQVASDALRYSNIPQYGGTARAIGAGGSMGAIGGDFSTITTNPAGLATYRSGELVITPGFHGAKTSSVLDGGDLGTSTQRYSKMSLDNLGIVFKNQGRDNSKWKTLNFALGFNRLQDFSSNVYYEGSTKGSLTARFRDQANSTGLDPFESELADSTGAIYYSNNKKRYVTDFEAAPDAKVYRSQVIETRGTSSEMVIAFAGNYNEKVQIGGTIGVPFIHFTESKIYKEENRTGEVPFFNSLQYNQDLTTNGVGINAKLGAIIRPTRNLRFGLAVHTPTKYQMNDAYTNSLTYDYTDSSAVSKTFLSPNGAFKYKLITPWRFIGSAALIVGKSGFINADIEWADYGKSNFSFEKDYITAQNDVNQQITARYKKALNVRLGGEYVYDIFRFRAGVGLNGSPRQGQNFLNTTYNAGVGLRGRSFYMDFAWQLRTQKENYKPYQVLETQANTEQNVTNSYTYTDYIMTFGIKF